MQLDKTEIVIRQRSTFELLDLSLLVLRRHFRMIAAASALIGLPLLALDVYAISWMLQEDALLAAEHLENPELSMRMRYLSHLVLLFTIQFPIASLPATIFLGNQIFYEPMPLKRIVQRLAPIAWRCVLILGIFRLGLVTLPMEWAVNRNVAFDFGIEFWVLFIFGGIALFLRAGWPFAPEILGLELCPLKSGKGGEITYAQRSRGLHKLLIADHIARFFGASVCGILLTLMLVGTALFLQGVTTGDWSWSRWFYYLILPLMMWAVGLYMVVLRFLCYLDSRIRLEGWEIELRLRAEAERLVESHAPPAPIHQEPAGSAAS